MRREKILKEEVRRQPAIILDIGGILSKCQHDSGAAPDPAPGITDFTLS
jgi:hypothetical protein